MNLTAHDVRIETSQEGDVLTRFQPLTGNTHTINLRTGEETGTPPKKFIVDVDGNAREETEEDSLLPIELRVTQFVSQVQNRLDNFAKTRNYDGILSACTYASSSVAKFQQEGVYAVHARDLTWAKMYEILGGVEAGTRPVPNTFSEIEVELPELVWPD